MIKHLSNINKSILICLLLILPFSCDDPTEGLKVIIDTQDIVDADFAIQFFDANVETLIPPSDITIEIIGEDADQVIDLLGNKDFGVAEGFVTLAIMPGLEPTEDDPIQFSIIAKAPGYLTSSKSIVITDLEEDNNFEISLLNKANPPKGVGVLETTFGVSTNGEVSEEQSFATPNIDGIDEVAEIQIEKGTILYDANGQVITGVTSVTASVAFFSDQEEESLFAFPGGFVANNLVDTDGTELEPVQFTTAGLVDITMFAGNTEVKSFSKPINVTIGINENTLNPDMEYANVAAGDTIPVFSMERETDTWKYEGISVVENVDGKLKATFALPHLSPWNWDWVWRSWWRRRYIATTCWARASVSSNIDRYTYGSNYYYTELVDASNNRVINRTWRRLYNGENIWFSRIRQNTQVKMRVYEGYYWWSRGSLIAESSTFSSCNMGSITLDLPQPQLVEVDLKGVCSNNPDLEVRPSAYVYYKKSTDRWWRYLGYLRKGKLSTSGRIELGETYTFGVSYGGVFYTDDIKVEETSNVITIDLPYQYCQNF